MDFFCQGEIWGVTLGGSPVPPSLARPNTHVTQKKNLSSVQYVHRLHKNTVDWVFISVNDPGMETNFISLTLSPRKLLYTKFENISLEIKNEKKIWHFSYENRKQRTSKTIEYILQKKTCKTFKDRTLFENSSAIGIFRLKLYSKLCKIKLCKTKINSFLFMF